MIKETITYVDYDGNERTEDFYFNMTTTEKMDIESTMPNGNIEDWVNSVVATRDYESLWKLFGKLIKMSYGIKSADGRRFMKSEEITKEFSETQAYPALIEKFLTDTEYASNFFNALMTKPDKKATMPSLSYVSKTGLAEA